MTPKKRVLRLLFTAFLLYLLYLVIVFAVQRKALYPGASHHFEPPPPPTWVERWEYDGGHTHAYFARGPDENSPGVVLLHGNLQCAEHLFGLAARWRERGFAVLIPEYRGYAGARGEPTQETITTDTAAFVARFANDPTVDPARLVYQGLSLGGGVAGAVAGERAPRALILQSTFSSIADIASQFYAPGFLARDPYDTRGLLANNDIPTLLMHGEDDDVVPVSHAHVLAREAKNAELVLFPGKHGIPLPESSAKYWATIDAFLQKQGLRSSGSSPE